MDLAVNPRELPTGELDWTNHPANPRAQKSRMSLYGGGASRCSTYVWWTGIHSTESE